MRRFQASMMPLKCGGYGRSSHAGAAHRISDVVNADMLDEIVACARMMGSLDDVIVGVIREEDHMEIGVEESQAARDLDATHIG